MAETTQHLRDLAFNASVAGHLSLGPTRSESRCGTPGTWIEPWLWRLFGEEALARDHVQRRRWMVVHAAAGLDLHRHPADGSVNVGG